MEETKVFVKTVQLATGVDLLASKTSLSAKEGVTTLELTSWGIKAYSRNSNRIVGIPFSNIKGFEFFSDASIAPKKPGRPKVNA